MDHFQKKGKKFAFVDATSLSSKFIFHHEFDDESVHDVVFAQDVVVVLYCECPHSVQYAVSTHHAISVFVAVRVTQEFPFEWRLSTITELLCVVVMLQLGVVLVPVAPVHVAPIDDIHVHDET